MTAAGIPSKDDKDAQIEFLKEALREIRRMAVGEAAVAEGDIPGFVDARLMDVTY